MGMAVENAMRDTVKLYDAQPYAREFDATVVFAEPGKEPGTVRVALDATLFFPEEGGQTPDRGVLAGFPVVDVQLETVLAGRSEGTEEAAHAPEDAKALKESGDACRVIVHLVDVRQEQALLPDAEEGAAARTSAEDVLTTGDSVTQNALQEEVRTAISTVLAPGQGVHGTLDWQHRYSNMQNHSGEHILSGLLHSIWGYENVGFRLSENTVTLDTGGMLTPEEVLFLEQKANEAVWRNAVIRCEYPAREELEAMDYRSKKAIDGPIRIVTIDGVDICACCAPHVARTGEIGMIKILSAEKNRNATRLTIACGDRALRMMQTYQQQLEQASRLMNEPRETAAAGIRRLLEEIQGLKSACTERELQYAEMLFHQVESEFGKDENLTGKDIFLFEESLSNLPQRTLMNRLCEMGWRYAGVFVGNEEAGWRYLIGSRSADARIPNKALRDSLGAKGGGKPEMVQGTVMGERSAVEAAMWNCLDR